MVAFRRIVAKQLGELLKERKIISEAQLQEALNIQSSKGGLVGEILVKLGYAKEEEIAQVLTVQYGFPYLPMDNYEIDREIIKILPVETVKKYGAIPIDKIGATLTVAMVNPLNASALEEIEKLTKCTVQPFITTSSSFQKALKKYYPPSPT
ncbi:MAG: hypothetical protein NTV07_07320 [Candidatus Omnitrophica bacterium]|nr:hypothetical protein [Candidatus Omnitrophota bacterium]